MAKPTPPARPGVRVYDGVQCLRFVAAILVVLTHATFYASERLGGGIKVFDHGTDGVDLFFVISGFVMYVSSAHLAERKQGWLEFVVRRLIRIVPLYWLLTTVKVAVMLASPKVVLHAQLNWAYILKSYLLLPALAADGTVSPLLGVGWTLVFEMFFYGLFALALLLRIRIVPFLAATILPCVALSFAATPAWPIWTVYLSPHLLEFLLGVFIAAWGVGRQVPVPAAAGAVVAGALGLAIFPTYWDGHSETIARVALPAALVVWGLVALEPAMTGKWPRWLVYMGGASYSLYLAHGLIAPASPQIMLRLGLHWPVAAVLGSLVLALAATMGVYILFERPVTRRLTRWAKRTLPDMTAPLPVSAA